jgi:hypothetical protein
VEAGSKQAAIFFDANGIGPDARADHLSENAQGFRIARFAAYFACRSFSGQVRPGLGLLGCTFQVFVFDGSHNSLGVMTRTAESKPLEASHDPIFNKFCFLLSRPKHPGVQQPENPDIFIQDFVNDNKRQTGKDKLSRAFSSARFADFGELGQPQYGGSDPLADNNRGFVVIAGYEFHDCHEIGPGRFRPFNHTRRPIL